MPQGPEALALARRAPPVVVERVATIKTQVDGDGASPPTRSASRARSCWTPPSDRSGRAHGDGDRHGEGDGERDRDIDRRHVRRQRRWLWHARDVRLVEAGAGDGAIDDV